MKLLVRLPRNEQLLGSLGSYPAYLNVLRSGGTAVQRRLTRRGLAGYETNTQATILSLMQMHLGKRLTFYDIGAHIGLYSAMVCSIYRAAGASAVAFEPTPDTAAKAIRLRDKNLLNYHVAQLAASSQAGEVDFFLSTKAETSNSMNAEFRPGSKAIRVRTDTLDSFVSAGAPAPSVMKIDVETFESYTVAGAKEMIARFRPWIVCEILPEANEQATVEMLKTLSDLEYKIYPIYAKPAWAEIKPDDLMKLRSHSNRDWILAPAALPASFEIFMTRWMDSISECGPETNIVTDDRKLVSKHLKMKCGDSSDPS